MDSKKVNIVKSLLTSFILIVLAMIIIRNGPGALFGKSWEELIRQHGDKARILFIVFIITVVLYCLAYVLFKFKKSKTLNFLLAGYIISLSIVSGFSFTFMTYTLNRVVTSKLDITYSLTWVFFGTLFLYSFIIKVVRKEITTMTNEYIFYKRKKILECIAKCDYESYEQIGRENIYTCINNDTESISNVIGVAVSGMTSLIVLLCTCIYLAVTNLKLFSIALVAILIVFLVIVVISYISQKRWDYARTKQDVFYRYFDGLLKGFADLIMKKRKITEYMEDINKENEVYAQSRIRAEVYFSYVAFFTEVLIFSFLGIIILVLPLSDYVTLTEVAEFFVVFLMLKGHFDVVVNSLPQIPKINTSRKRINELLNQFNATARKRNEALEFPMKGNDFDTLQYKNIEYEYKNNKDKVFKIGPMDLSFKKGEITFIIGGNGSGKSTLGKVITGLYKPDKGAIYYNSAKVNDVRISELFSTIFFDNYLFQKLYGIDKNQDTKKMDTIIHRIRLNDKIKIEDGRISDINLSTGQKKRVALLISYLENANIYFFDEWAAEQDPEFKLYFYTELLPKLKKEGKCVIAITHDDRYFSIADKIIKIEEGKIVSVR